jgi:hypothetical protein
VAGCHGDQVSLRKNAQNAAKPNLSKLINNYGNTVQKCRTKIRYLVLGICNFKKMPKVNNPPTCENSPNLVTMLATFKTTLAIN